MTPAEFTAWRDRMGWTKRQAAAELGIGINIPKALEDGTTTISRTIELACEALETRRQQEVAP